MLEIEVFGFGAQVLRCEVPLVVAILRDAMYCQLSLLQTSLCNRNLSEVTHDEHVPYDIVIIVRMTGEMLLLQANLVRTQHQLFNYFMKLEGIEPRTPWPCLSPLYCLCASVQTQVHVQI